jgi:hypothetical protein
MQFSPKLEEYRLCDGEYASQPGASFGAFVMPGPCGAILTIIADDGEETLWEHVSVSTPRRIPNWTEMSFVKRLFWAPDECVVQFHPPEMEYVNNHPHVLHLWRYTRGAFPMPPSILVGVKKLGIITNRTMVRR